MPEAPHTLVLIGFGLAFFIPLLGAAYCCLRKGRHLAAVSTGSMAAALLAMSLVNYTWFEHINSTIHYNIDWISLPGALKVPFSIALSPPILALGTCTLLISFCVHLYSISYMSKTTKGRYYALLSIFSSTMLAVYAVDDLLVMWIFWGSMGICSYLLISYLGQNRTTAEASREVLIISKMADIGFLGGLCLLWTCFESTNISNISNLSAELKSLGNKTPLISICGMLFLWSACVKSAQFPTGMWVIAAMRGVTPVSALLHSSTLVAAGVFLIGRLYFLLSPALCQTLVVIGLCTACLAALSACVQTRAKAFLAYSTISQLGYMVLMMGLGYVGWAFMYIIIHAVAKSLLFMSTGTIARQLGKDGGWKTPVYALKSMGGGAAKLPLPYLSCIFGAGVLLGLPLLAGALPKALLLAALWQKGGIILLLGLLAFICTGLYVGRFLYFLFGSEPTAPTRRLRRLKVWENAPLQAPLWIGSLCCIGIFYQFPKIDGLSWLMATMESTEGQGLGMPAEMPSFWLQSLLGSLPILAAATSYLYSRKNKALNTHFPKLYSLLRRHFYIKQLQNYAVSRLGALGLFLKHVEKHAGTYLGLRITQGALLSALIVRIIDETLIKLGIKSIFWTLKKLGKIMDEPVQRRLNIHMIFVLLLFLCLAGVLHIFSP